MSHLPNTKIKIEMPDADWREQADRRCDYTPDIWQLEKKRFQLTFVCDELQRNMIMHHQIGEYSRSVCKAFTKERFSLWRMNLGKVSRVIPLRTEFYGAELHSIKGELYATVSQQYPELDKYKQNGVLYQRERVRLVIPTKTIKWSYPEGHFSETPSVYIGTAWMWIGIPEYWNNLLDGGYHFSPVKRFTPRNLHVKRYYCYTPLEANV